MEPITQSFNQNQGCWAAYHQGYDPIYTASYEFGFVFVDEDELDSEDDDDLDDEEDEEETLMLVH